MGRIMGASRAYGQAGIAQDVEEGHAVGGKCERYVMDIEYYKETGKVRPLTKPEEYKPETVSEQYKSANNFTREYRKAGVEHV